jgi:hypothetical protein
MMVAQSDVAERESVHQTRPRHPVPDERSVLAAATIDRERGSE